MIIIELFYRKKPVMRIFRLGPSNQRNASQKMVLKQCKLTEYCKIFADLQVQMSVFGTFHVLILIIFLKINNLSTLK